MLDATKNLPNLKIALKEKVLMNGFSASGTFAKRFALIHPDRVVALATGGINATTILPIKSLEKHSLDYPIGINDFEKIFRYKPNLKIYKKIPQLIFMGEKDNKDAVLFDDAYSPEDNRFSVSLNLFKLTITRSIFVTLGYFLTIVVKNGLIIKMAKTQMLALSVVATITLPIIHFGDLFNKILRKPYLDTCPFHKDLSVRISQCNGFTLYRHFFAFNNFYSL